MNRLAPFALAGVVLLAGPSLSQDAAAPQAGDPELWLLPKVIQSAVAKVRPAVVTVETFGGIRKQLAPRRPPGNRPQPPRPEPKEPEGDDEGDEKKKKPKHPIVMPGFLQAQGPSTGLVIGSDGWILTSRFALNYDPSSILVTLDDGRKFTAELYGEDRTRGLALLKVDATDLPVAELCPVEETKVGQWAFAVARSFASKGPTVHAGMVSAVRRISGRAVQCDASTSPANYGGPLVDLDGRVLGLIAPLSSSGDMAGADWYDSGIGFAATLADIGDKIEGMKARAIYEPAKLGVGMDLAFLGPGGKVATTAKDTAAQHANLRKGDIVLRVGDIAVNHSTHLQDLIGAHVAGDWVTLAIKKKDGREVEVLVEL